MEERNFPADFEAWMKEEFEPDELKDIVEHGCQAGFHGLTYYKDTGRLYRKYHDEIWRMLCDDAEDMGYPHALALIASFNGAVNVYDDGQLENLLVWYAAERTAARLVEA